MTENVTSLSPATCDFGKQVVDIPHGASASYRGARARSCAPARIACMIIIADLHMCSMLCPFCAGQGRPPRRIPMDRFSTRFARATASTRAALLQEAPFWLHIPIAVPTDRGARITWPALPLPDLRVKLINRQAAHVQLLRDQQLNCSSRFPRQLGKMGCCIF